MMSDIIDRVLEAFNKDAAEAEATTLKLWEKHIQSNPIEKEFSTAIIAFNLMDDNRVRLAQSSLNQEEIVEDVHITLLFLNDVAKLEQADLYLGVVRTVLEEFAKTQAPIEGNITGAAIFDRTESSDWKYPYVLLYDSPQLPFLRTQLHEVFRSLYKSQNVKLLEQDHGFIPHVTLGYLDDKNIDIQPQSWDKRFDTIWLFWGDERYAYPLTGTKIEKQLPISDESKTALISARIAAFQDEVTALTERMYTGELSLGSWEEQMKALIRGLHSSAAAIGKGGWTNMTQSDWGRIGNPLKAQYRYLHGFAQDISDTAETVALGTLQRRARMYGDAAAQTAMLMYADYFKSYLPWMPRDGSTECLVSCKCEWRKINERLNKAKTSKTVTMVWKLNPAEHCIDCIDRDGYKVTFVVPAKVQVPLSIGGFV